VWCSLCEEFEAIAERALREVATTEELMDMIEYIEKARTQGMLRLNRRVAVSVHSHFTAIHHSNPNPNLMLSWSLGGSHN